MDDPKIKGAQEEARAFVKLLLEVLCPKYEGLQVYVALTMRSDFLGACALFSGLADAINNGLYLLPQMEREQFRDAIKGPVDVGGGKISERLIDTLINDLRDDTDQLPILQHAMMRLWDRWSQDGGEKIDFEHYRQIGELSATLCNHAEEVFTSLDQQRQQPIAEAVFRSITRVNEGKIVRCQTKLGLIRKSSKLTNASFEEVVAVINEFRADGRSFLVPPINKAIDDETAIDISHESLIRQWKRLRHWAEDEALNQELYRQIAEGSRIWVGKKRDESYLFTGKRVLEADEWANNNPGILNEVENEFLVASQNVYEKKYLEQPKKELSERVVAEGATQAEAIEKESAHVFLAFARQDRAFAEQLREAFKDAGEETLVDWDILPSENFEQHLRAAIEAADTFVYVISPSSVESHLCRQQLQHAISQGKRIVPVLLHKVDDWKLPEHLKSEHWVRFTAKDNFDDAFRILREAINSELFWVRAHTRLLVRATEWKKKDQDSSQLLRGRELSEAEQWLGKDTLEPELTPLQKQYILASRADTSKNQKIKLAYATASLIVSLILLGVALMSAGYAFRQANFAEQQRVIAEASRKKAQEEKTNAEESAARAAIQEKFATRQFELAMKSQDEADHERVRALEAMKQQQVAQQDALRRKAYAEYQQRLTGDAVNKTIALVLGDAESPEEISKLAETYVRQGDFKTAANIYRLLVLNIGAVDPKVAAGYYLSYARVLRRLGRMDEAANLQKKARAVREEQRQEE